MELKIVERGNQNFRQKRLAKVAAQAREAVPRALHYLHDEAFGGGAQPLCVAHAPPGVPEPQEALFQWSREQLTPRVDSAVLTDEFAAGHNTWLADDDVDAERQADELREALKMKRITVLSSNLTKLASAPMRRRGASTGFSRVAENASVEVVAV